MPEGNNGDHHVHAAEHQVEDEEEEVALILHAYAVVDPRTVMIHKVHALLADRAMMRSRWLNDLARITLFRPKLLQIRRCLAAVAQKLLHVAGEALEQLISTLICHINLLPIGAVLLLSSHLLDHFGISRAAGFENDSVKVIEHDVIDQGQSYHDPKQAKVCSNSILE